MSALRNPLPRGRLVTVYATGSLATSSTAPCVWWAWPAVRPPVGKEDSPRKGSTGAPGKQQRNPLVQPTRRWPAQGVRGIVLSGCFSALVRTVGRRSTWGRWPGRLGTRLAGGSARRLLVSCRDAPGSVGSHLRNTPEHMLASDTTTAITPSGVACGTGLSFPAGSHLSCRENASAFSFENPQPGAQGFCSQPHSLPAAPEP